MTLSGKVRKVGFSSTEETEKLLEELAKKWRTTKSQAYRRVILERAILEGIDITAKRSS